MILRLAYTNIPFNGLIETLNLLLVITFAYSPPAMMRACEDTKAPSPRSDNGEVFIVSVSEMYDRGA